MSTLNFPLTGRWDDLEEISNALKLLQHLHEIAGNCYMVNDINLPADAPGNLKGDQGNPFEHFAELQRMYAPLGLSGIYTIRGIDTAANGYPMPTEIALDKQGNPLTIEVNQDMSAFDITVAMVAVADAAFDGFPHHCYFEDLDIDTVAHTLTFSMGS